MNFTKMHNTVILLNCGLNGLCGKGSVMCSVKLFGKRFVKHFVGLPES